MYKLGILGVGKMGGAILDGVIKGKIFDKTEVLLGLHNNKIGWYLNEGFKYTTNPTELFKNSEIIVIAIKPQFYEETLKDLSDVDFLGKTIISIAPGITISYLENLFPNANIIRAMPNTAAAINKSITTYATSSNDQKAVEHFIKIFSQIGLLHKVEEKDIDLFIPLNGSMPAYLGLFIKSFIDEAVRKGASYEAAKRIALETIISCGYLMLESKEPLEVQINNVCSKGGTTIAGLNKLNEKDFPEAIKECFDACYQRSIELKK